MRMRGKLVGLRATGALRSDDTAARRMCSRSLRCARETRGRANQSSGPAQTEREDKDAIRIDPDPKRRASQSRAAWTDAVDRRGVWWHRDDAEAPTRLLLLRDLRECQRCAARATSDAHRQSFRDDQWSCARLAVRKRDDATCFVSASVRSHPMGYERTLSTDTDAPVVTKTAGRRQRGQAAAW